MNKKGIFGLLGTAALTAMLGCNTSKPVPEVEAAPLGLPPAEIESRYHAKLIPPQPLATSNPIPEVQAAPLELQPPTGIENGYYAELIPPQSLMEPPGRVCLLGTTCLSMDQRPFELCLLSTRHCRDKAAEPMQVAPPRRDIPEPSAEPRLITTLAQPQ